MLGAGMLLAAEGMEAFEQAAMDGGGGFAVELLVDDALDQRFKRRLRAGDAQVNGPARSMRRPSFGIGGGEFFDRRERSRSEEGADC